MIRAFDHTSFTVADIDVAVAFWRDVMGLRLDDLSRREQPWLGRVVGLPGATCRVAHLRGHGSHLELIEYDEGWQGENVFGPANRPGAAHLAFWVDDIAAAVEQMTAGGATRLGEVTLCASGPVADCLAIYLRDPGGIIVELVEEVGG